MEKYVKLKDVEKSIIKRVDWNYEASNALEIRNDILDVLETLDYIDVENKTCKYCSPEYNQYIEATCIRRHTSNEESLHRIDVNYCPDCGRQLKR